MADHDLEIRLLQASVDPDGEGSSEFRILVNNKFVKYITIDGGLFEPDEMCFGPSLFSLLPTLPPGNWNEGRISRDSTSGVVHFAAFSKTNLLGVTKIWHPTQIDHLELRMGRKLRSNLYEATCTRFSQKVVVKFARFPWEVPLLEKETMAYEWIEGHQVAPPFLGHLSEEGRIIGFIMARIDDFHHATPEDLPQCQLALSKLHQLRIKHGDINKHNFLIHDGKATLIDFDNASQEASANELEDEFRNLLEQLSDTSGRGGRIVENCQS